MSKNIVIAGAARTPVGAFNGGLSSVPAHYLGQVAIEAALADSGPRLIPKDPDLVYKVMRAVMRTVHRILRRMNFQYTQLMDYISHQHGRY